MIEYCSVNNIIKWALMNYKFNQFMKWVSNSNLNQATNLLATLKIVLICCIRNEAQHKNKLRSYLGHSENSRARFLWFMPRTKPALLSIFWIPHGYHRVNHVCARKPYFFLFIAGLKYFALNGHIQFSHINTGI